MECEAAVKEILPAVRSLLAAELKKQGLKQEQIAKKLDLKQPAVSRYLRQSRGKKAQEFAQNKKIKELIKKTASEIKTGQKFDFCFLCKKIREIEKCCD